MHKRKEDGQDGAARFRTSSRLFRLNHEWYFTTREGDLGPFRSETLAQKELNRFMLAQKELNGFMKGVAPDDRIELRDATPKADPSVWDKYDQLN